MNSKYLEINLKLVKLKTHIKFLINNYTYHNEKDARDIIEQYAAHLNEIELCYTGFQENCEQFENVITEAEQLSLYFDQEIFKFMDKLSLDGESIAATLIDDDLEFLNDEPTVLETESQESGLQESGLLESGLLNTSAADANDSLHCSPNDLNISGMQYMRDSMEATPSPDDTIFISKNSSMAGVATPMVKSSKKKLQPRLLMVKNMKHC